MKNAILSEVVASSLLDRLSNRSKDQVADATVSRGELQATNLRESIIRNLNWLLETTHMESSMDLSPWPNVRASVMNFGVPEFTGALTSDVDSNAISRKIVAAIRKFEPRISSDSLQVQVTADGSVSNCRALQLIITGKCLDQGTVYDVHVTANVDTETGRVNKISA